MNWDQIEGQWKTLKGTFREKWGKLTDQDIEAAAGKKEQIIGKIQQRYGIAKEKAEKEVDDFIAQIKTGKK